MCQKVYMLIIVILSYNQPALCTSLQVIFIHKGLPQQ